MALSSLSAGLTVRNLAADALENILSKGVTFDDYVDGESAIEELDARDRGFFMALVLTALRRKGEADRVIDSFLTSPLPRKSGNARIVLLLGAVQLLFFGVAAHATLDLSVRLARTGGNASRFTGLINAVLRKIATGGPSLFENVDAPRLNTPGWLWSRWCRTYGPQLTASIAKEHVSEPSLDISVKRGGAFWADRLQGLLLPTGTVRLGLNRGAVDLLPGFSDGDWWVQDAAAALPAKLFGNLAGKTALDLCAAPGGKTLQLCAAGAGVTAVDVSLKRLARMSENLKRASYHPEVIHGDVTSLDLNQQFDAVLLDAPCSATGTIRRHPDLPYLKSAQQIDSLALLQRKMLDRSSAYVNPGGRLVYCVCSLEPEEGERQIERFLHDHPDFKSLPIEAGEAGIESHLINADGQLRTLPHMTIGTSNSLDGFFAARLTRRK